MAESAALQPNNHSIWQRATFHAKQHGHNIMLSTNCSVAKRATTDAGQKVDGHGVVFTNPVPEGSMLRVAVLDHSEILKGGLGVFLTTEDPKTSSLAKSGMAAALHAPGQSQLIGVFNNKIFYGGRPLGARHNLSKATESLKSGDSVGIRLVQGNKLELYYNDKLFKTFSLENGYPQKTQMWGVVDVYGSCVKVKADFVRTPNTGTGIPASRCPQQLTKGASLDSHPTQQIKQLQKQLDNERANYAAEKVRLMKELDEAKKQLAQERQEHQILLQGVEADLKSNEQLWRNRLKQERQETQLQLEALEAELSRTKQVVDGLRLKLSEAERQVGREASHHHKLQQLETENASLKNKLQELQESSILNMRDPIPRMVARRPSYRGPGTHPIPSELRRISGQDIWLRARGTQQ